MTVEVVADGIHVPPTILRLVYKIKGVERTCLITDALACAASDSQVAFDPRVIIEDGVCKLADHSALAGSIATMDRLIRTMVQKAEIPLEDAVRMASETPARIMGGGGTENRTPVHESSLIGISRLSHSFSLGHVARSDTLAASQPVQS